MAKAVNQKTWAIPIRSNGQRYSASPVTAPTAIARTVDSSVQITLQASGGSSSLGTNVGYRYRRDTVLLNSSPTASAYVDSGRTANTSYSYTATLVDSSGNESNISAAFTAATPASSDTIPPTVPVIAAQALSQSTIRVTLVTPSTDAGGFRDYTLQTSNTASGPWTDLLTAIQAASLPYTHAGLPASALRYYRLLAFDTVGNQATSAVQTAITNSAGGTVDGSTVTVTGPTATVPDIVENFGLLGGVQDSGTPGAKFSRALWTQGFPDGEGDWKFTTSRLVGARSRSIVFDPLANGSPSNGRGTFYYDYGAAGISQEYRSCNFFWNVPGLRHQWKIWRGNHIQDVTDGADPSWYISSNGAGVPLFISVYAQDSLHWIPTDPRPPENQWFRLELFITHNSPLGTANGVARLRATSIATGAVLFDQTVTGIRFRGTGAAALRWGPWQNYLGNSGTTVDHANASITMDGIYASAMRAGVGAFVRAELCDNASYAASSKRVPCRVNSIVNGEWSVTLDRGHHVPTNLAGLWLALFDANNSPTMRQVPNV